MEPKGDGRAAFDRLSGSREDKDLRQVPTTVYKVQIGGPLRPVSD